MLGDHKGALADLDRADALQPNDAYTLKCALGAVGPASACMAATCCVKTLGTTLYGLLRLALHATGLVVRQRG